MYFKYLLLLILLTLKDVTGVSRSGRVRKKSSKLADFESPDEIEPRYKRKMDKPMKSPGKMGKIGPPPLTLDMYGDSDTDDDEDDDDDNDNDNDEDDDDNMDIKDEPLDEDVWEEEDDMGDLDGPEAIDHLQVDEDSTDTMSRDTASFSQAHSVYLSEKQNKKNMLSKDGLLVQRKKAQRKDKGKSRFTAYMLWAREIRPGIIQANPNMDFSAVNKRLGELWALVPTSQKYNWKRRAKRLAAKGGTKGSMIWTGKPLKQSSSGPRSNLINKGGSKPQQVVKSGSKLSNEGGSSQNLSMSSKLQATPNSSKMSGSNELSPSSVYKVIGSSPIDVASHLKLLGESLNNIGQKLKEHEGQIAVSGSLSVLLDSMLCVLGPLTCLTTQVEELKGAIPQPTLLSILDNIAYIMPGIV